MWWTLAYHLLAIPISIYIEIALSSYMTNSKTDLTDREKEWLKYLRGRLKAVEDVFSWILIVSGIVIPLLIGQLFIIIDSYMVTSSGMLDLSAINLLRSGSLFCLLIIFIILVYWTENRAFKMRKQIIKIIHEILGEIENLTHLKDWKEKYLKWRYLFDEKDEE